MRTRKIYTGGSSEKKPLEEWILCNLWLYGNCLISGKRIKYAEGNASFLEMLRKKGYVCSLRKSVVDNRFYIIELNRLLKKGDRRYRKTI